jgi:cyclopropane-fatty-acyl-phospholipid synthase
MSGWASAIHAFENAPVPDSVRRAAVALLVGATARRLTTPQPGFEADFARAMADHDIAEHPDAANAQHYELPPEFFALTLGPRRKYSCCLYDAPATTLAHAEDAALAFSSDFAGLADGQDVLELGCGWGSLSLWMAEHYPASRITAVSNSAPQRAAIEALAAARGFTNLRVITADMNDFAAPGRYDRIVSVEMFEHMSNWRDLLARARSWLNPDGRLYLHVFSHTHTPYRFDHTRKSDWIAQHFFTGGVMPSHGLVRHFGDLFAVEDDARWSGIHYARTANDWLARYDSNTARIGEILRDVYGAEAALWNRRWRLFYLATSGLFGAERGNTWGVSHYRLRPC